MAPVDYDWPQPYIENVTDGEEVYNVAGTLAWQKDALIHLAAAAIARDWPSRTH